MTSEQLEQANAAVEAEARYNPLHVPPWVRAAFVSGAAWGQQWERDRMAELLAAVHAETAAHVPVYEDWCMAHGVMRPCSGDALAAVAALAEGEGLP